MINRSLQSRSGLNTVFLCKSREMLSVHIVNELDPHIIWENPLLSGLNEFPRKPRMVIIAIPTMQKRTIAISDGHHLVDLSSAAVPLAPLILEEALNLPERILDHAEWLKH